jgi:hypothetical protein
MGMKINSDARPSPACLATLRLPLLCGARPDSGAPFHSIDHKVGQDKALVALVSGHGVALLPVSLVERGMSAGCIDPPNFTRQRDGTFKSRKRRRGPVPIGGKPGPLQVLLLVIC